MKGKYFVFLKCKYVAILNLSWAYSTFVKNVDSTSLYTYVVCVILSENNFTRSLRKPSFQNVIWMTESQEFFLVVRGGGAGIDSAIFLKVFIVML